MTKLFSLTTAGLLLLGTPAMAQVTSMASTNAASENVSARDLTKVVCEVDETTGTRLGRTKVCKTIAEWRDQRRQHREGVEEFQRMGTSTGCPEMAAPASCPI